MKNLRQSAVAAGHDGAFQRADSDALHNPHEHERRQYARTAIGKKRKGDAGNRKNADVHADVYYQMHEKYRRHAKHEKAGKVVSCPHADTEETPKQHAIDEQ